MTAGSRLAAALLLVAGLACGSGLAGAPGGAVDDWSFVRDARNVTFAAGDGTPIRLALAHPMVVKGRLYLHAMTLLDVADPALRAILREGRVQMAVRGRVWRGRAVPLTRAAEIDPLLPELLRLSHVQGTAPHWNPQPARYPGTQLRQWFFRLDLEP